MRGLTEREEMGQGFVFGFSWRHFGAKCVVMRADFTGQGAGQLAKCISKIMQVPIVWRILFFAVNPAGVSRSDFPPCLISCLLCAAHGELPCLMYQCCFVLGLGVPFCFASFSLPTLVLAQVCGF